MTSIEKSQSFVSVVTVIDIENIDCVNRLASVQNYLNQQYSDYEILLMVKKEVQAAIHLYINNTLKTIPAIRYLQLTSNPSDEIALAAGLENAIGDFILLINLASDPIDNIGKAIEMCKAGHDVVIGTAQNPCSVTYSIARPLVTGLLRYIDYRLPRNATNFRCLSRRVANAIMAAGHFHRQLFMKIQKSGFEAAELNYIAESKKVKTFTKGFREVMSLMVFNSSAPLRLMSGLGLSASAFACLVSLYAVTIRFLQDDVVSGWASTILLISVFAFIQFIILSFISEYLARLLTEQKHSQDYSIVFEKNSLVMVNQDRINVLDDSTNVADTNLVQTGRNK